MLKRAPLFIRLPLTHVYVGTEGERNTVHAIAKSGNSVSKTGTGHPGLEMIGARGCDAKLPFHMNMRDYRQDYRQGVDFLGNLL